MELILNKGKNISLLKESENYLLFDDGSLIFKNGIKSIDAHLTCDIPAELVKRVVLPKSLKCVGVEAFKDFYNLSSVEFNEGLEVIEENAFLNSALENCDLPKTVTQIKSSAFRNTQIKSIKLPKDCEVLIMAFADNKQLCDVVFGGNNKLNYGVFNICPNLKNLVFKDLDLQCSFADECDFDSLTFENVNIETRFSLNSGVNKIIYKTDKQISKDTMSSLIGNFPPLLYSQIKDGEILFTNNKAELEKGVPYIFNPILQTGKVSSFDIAKHSEKLCKELMYYEIPLPEKFLMELNAIEKFDRVKIFDGLNMSKFKRVSNVIEKEVFSRHKCPELGTNVENLYKLAYNLGAFSDDEEVRTMVCNFLKDKLSRNEYTRGRHSIDDVNVKKELELSDMTKLYGTMTYDGYKADFTKFFIDNFMELKKLNGELVCRFYNEFEEIQRINKSRKGEQRQLKPSVKVFKRVLEDIDTRDFDWETDEEREIAVEVSKFFTNETAYHFARDIMKEFKNKHVKNSLVSDINAIKDNSENEYQFKWLLKNDTKNLTLGNYCDCCAHLEGKGYNIMRASILSNNLQNLVVINDGDIIAKATLYINKQKGYGIFNTFEVKNTRAKEGEQILDAIKSGVDVFVNQYNKENPNNKIKQINVGLSRNDLAQFFADSKSNERLKMFDFTRYSVGEEEFYEGDAMKEDGQAIIYKSKELEKQEHLIEK